MTTIADVEVAEKIKEAIIAQARTELETKQGPNDETPEYVRTDAYMDYRAKIDRAFEIYEAVLQDWNNNA